MIGTFRRPVRGYAYNLLDNSDFRNPVNQRGATFAPEYDYGIDRWMEYAGAAQASFSFFADGMVLSGTLAQKIPSGAFITGNTYSAALYMADGSVLVASGVVHTAGSSWTTFASAENGNVGIAVFTDSQDGSYIGVRISASGEKIRGCALYEGEYTADTLPPYVPRGYGAELVECMRYYQSDNRVQYIPSLGGEDYFKILEVQFFVPMRTVPIMHVECNEPTYVVQISNNSGFEIRIADAANVSESNPALTMWTASADL